MNEWLPATAKQWPLPHGVAQENVQTASGEHSKWKRELWYASKGTPRLRLYFCSVTAEVI